MAGHPVQCGEVEVGLRVKGFQGHDLLKSFKASESLPSCAFATAFARVRKRDGVQVAFSVIIVLVEQRGGPYVCGAYDRYA